MLLLKIIDSELCVQALGYQSFICGESSSAVSFGQINKLSTVNKLFNSSNLVFLEGCSLVKENVLRCKGLPILFAVLQLHYYNGVDENPILSAFCQYFKYRGKRESNKIKSIFC